MTCCQWKRSANDILYDESTKSSYCGTCWQNWLTSQNLPNLASNATLPGDETNIEKGSDGDLEDPSHVTDDPRLHPLQTVRHTDEKSYLVSKATRLVFSTERTEDDKLRCVGECVDDTGDIRLCKVTSVSVTRSFPYDVDCADHCETPQAAYDDIAPVLAFLARRLGKERCELSIWDPYFCAGSVNARLSRHGFTNVRNECVDFYDIIANKRVPSHDVVVTNPPYSTSPIDHVHRLVSYVTGTRTPWLIVQPNYVYTKPFWQTLTATALCGPRPFFLTPRSPRAYKYKTPCGLRHVQHAQALNTSPFVTFWYCWLGPQHTAPLYRWLAAGVDGVKDMQLSLVCTEFFLSDGFKDSNDKTRRKKRKKGRGDVPLAKAEHCMPGSGIQKKKKKKKKKLDKK